MKCKLTVCKEEFTPTAPHQKFHTKQCRFRHHQMQRQRLIKQALKQQKGVKAHVN